MKYLLYFITCRIKRIRIKKIKLNTLKLNNYYDSMVSFKNWKSIQYSVNKKSRF